MLGLLARPRQPTPDRWNIVTAAIRGDLLDVCDDVLIGCVPAFLARDRNLSCGQSAMILPAAGAGAMASANRDPGAAGNVRGLVEKEDDQGLL